MLTLDGWSCYRVGLVFRLLNVGHSDKRLTEQMPEVLLHIPLRQKNMKNTDHFIVMHICKKFIHAMVMI